MKMLRPSLGDETVEQQQDYMWSVVIVHYEKDTERFRAVKVMDNGTIVQESTHNTREKAQAFIDKQ